MTGVSGHLGAAPDAGMAVAPSLDARAIAAGGLVAVVLVAVPAVAAQSLPDGSDWVLATFGLILAGFVVGGVFAGRRAPDAPYTHGALAALGAFAVIQGGFLLARASGVVETDTDVDLVRIVFFALLATSCGTLGGVLADWQDRRRIRRVLEQADPGHRANTPSGDTTSSDTAGNAPDGSTP